ncbi:MAG: 3',5'-cyclic-nucleotide phosphodiesterase [Actinobacteria bacterium HGW-Actinobacteria-9]|nr:MAG: 3',5'-cyclic-nucleotide phosphodiesterase [Actinobacteria bacterium HGW-Actinobacteria-9]
MVSAERPVIIAQISDLHCGSRYHIPSLATRVIDELNELEPDVVIVTGDLTDMGFRQEFVAAHRLLSGLKCERRMVLLGNHDARNVGDEHFTELFGSRNVELEYNGIHVLGVDSSEPDLDSGRVGRARADWIEEKFGEAEDGFKIVAMHHHLVPVPGTGRERNIVYDAGDLLRSLANCGTDLVLCGHKHVPNVWRLEDMLIVNAGTACSHRLRGRVRPCYNIIEIRDRSHVRINLKEPYVDAQVVADYRDINQPSCSWRSDDGPERYVEEVGA